jgi:hypothetical protein
MIRHALPAFAAVLGVLLCHGTALAYVRTTTVDGRPYHWDESCVTVTPSTRRSPDLDPGEISASVWAAALSWSREVHPCTYLRVRVDDPSPSAGTVRADGVNSVVLRQDRWCREPIRPGDPEMCYPSAALALTSIFARDADARIVDADLEINGVDFRWAILDGPDDPRGATYQDLPNTITHELGHVIGLDHNCYDPGTGRPRPVDQNGQPVPDCSQAPPEIRDTTMFFSAGRGDIGKRTLAADDIAGLCDAYPAKDDPHRCQRVTIPHSGCAVAPGADECGCTLLVIVALCTGLVSVRRRPRS